MSNFNVQSVMDVLFKKTEFKHLQGRNSSKASGLTFDSWQSRKFIFDFLPSYRWATATLRYLKCDRISAAVCASWLLGCCNSSCCFHVLFSTASGSLTSAQLLSLVTPAHLPRWAFHAATLKLGYISHWVMSFSFLGVSLKRSSLFKTNVSPSGLINKKLLLLSGIWSHRLGVCGYFWCAPTPDPWVRKETPSEFMRLIFSWLLFCSETCLEPWYVCEETSGLCPRGLPWWQFLTHHLGEFSSSARCDQKILDKI